MRVRAYAAILVAIGALAAAAARADEPPSNGCVTFVNAGGRPANVRYTANGAVLDALKDGTVVAADDDNDGWLHVVAPETGWIDMTQTSVRCGAPDAAPAEVLAAIQSLGVMAATDRAAMDMLVRYALVAGGTPARQTAVALGKLMTHHALQIVVAVDELTPDKRRFVLLSVLENGASAEQIRAFDKVVKTGASMPTLTTWSSIVEHCDERLHQLYPWLCIAPSSI